MTIILPEFANPLEALWWLLTHGGVIPFVIALGYGLWWLYVDTIQERYISKLQYVLLAVDVPRENEQTPKAVEHIFSHIHGIQRGANWRDKYIDGYVQPTISFELISIGGYIQYLIRCLDSHRDLVESAIYAQYPNAEIAEVEDYITPFMPVFPNDAYDMWGAEIGLVNKDAYPIRTYPLWEHPLTQTFLDPMASLLEVMGRLQQGENIWLQFILDPTPDDAWRKKGIAIINKLIGAKVKQKASALEQAAALPEKVIVGGLDTILSSLGVVFGSAGEKKPEQSQPNLYQFLPAHERIVVDAIGMKIAKLSFLTKCRFVYIANKNVFNRSRVAGVMGALKQFSSMDMNGFKPDKKMKTARDYFFVKRRVANLQRRILRAYRGRSTRRGRVKFVLNIEELASVWHFPVITVKAPLVKKTEAKRGEPPTSLPIGEEIEYVPKKRPEPTAVEAGPPSAEPTSRGAPPANLPVA